MHRVLKMRRNRILLFTAYPPQPGHPFMLHRSRNGNTRVHSITTTNDWRTGAHSYTNLACDVALRTHM